MSFDDLPESKAERAKMMEGILVEAATGGSQQTATYELFRREFMDDPSTAQLLPPFVRTYRTLGAFWPFIRDEVSGYASRRKFIGEAFTPLVDYLEGRNSHPSDIDAQEAFDRISLESVQAIWTKALQRRQTDPEGAITAARTLLETVCKRILDELAEEYDDSFDLPKLYGAVSKRLNLAPSQHSEEPIRAILGSVTNLVNGLGTLRNRLSDAHGRGGKLPVKPATRHAALAVNTAGSVASFLVETYLSQYSKD